MNKTLKTLPQLGNQLFLTDGGLETTLIFEDGFELPYFAAFHLLRDPKGRERSPAITSAISQSPKRMTWASFSKAQPGAPIPIGVRSWVTPGPNSPRRIASPST